MSNLVLELSNVTVKLGKFELKGIDQDLHPGDIFGVIGRSGAGKSTFIKGLVGHAKIKSGNIAIKKNGKKKNLLDYLGYSPQENSMYSYLTFDENMNVFAKLYGINKKVLVERKKTILKRLDLSREKNKRIRQMSGGMRKRADLAICLIHNPDILVLDEPFTGLDISLQEFIWNFLLYLSREGKIIIISSHNLTDLINNCTKLGLIHDGRFYSSKQLEKRLMTCGMMKMEDYLKKIFDENINK